VRWLLGLHDKLPFVLITFFFLYIAPLSIDEQPTDQIVDIGDNATFICNVTGGDVSVNYRWIFNDSALMADPGHISGVDTIILTITNITIDNGGIYSFEATDSTSSVVMCNNVSLISKWS